MTNRAPGRCSRYSGGASANPSYEDVCTGETGHAEVVQVTFDPEKVSLRDLLKVFFTLHDPTTRDRQGNDVGTQYRSVIFYRDAAQKASAEAAIAEIDASRAWGGRAVTQLEPFKAFYRAEDYHQDYYRVITLVSACGEAGTTRAGGHPRSPDHDGSMGDPTPECPAGVGGGALGCPPGSQDP